MNGKLSIDFCLLIPCYNNFRGLTESLQSVQYDNERLLILVVDDGSVEAISRDKILEQVGKEKPVMVLRNEQNSGITETLNKGLRWIRENTVAKYIARLDCGDTCDPQRFFLQVDYLNANPGIGLLGTWCRFTEKSTGLTYEYKTPLIHEEIAREMHLRNVFIHPTVMFRADLLETAGYYPDQYPHAEDYAYFWKMIQVTQTAVLDRILVTCELNRHGISFTNKSKQLAARRRVVKAFGTNRWLKIKGMLRLNLLFFLPKGLSLRLKQLSSKTK